MTDSKKPPTIKKMFADRMRREGKEKEFKANIRNKMAEEDSYWSHAQWKVMREMGYLAKDERKFYEEHLANEGKTKAQVKLKEERAEIVKEQIQETFEQAAASLPLECSPKEEIDWIRSHPAMARLNRDASKAKNIVITGTDILSAPHGVCPRQGAALALQHWANHPDEFFKMLLNDQKKNLDRQEEIGEEVETEADMSELKRMLKEAREGQTK
jgi:hypothetical protein